MVLVNGWRGFESCLSPPQMEFISAQRNSVSFVLFGDPYRGAHSTGLILHGGRVAYKPVSSTKSTDHIFTVHWAIQISWEEYKVVSVSFRILDKRKSIA